MAGSLSRPRYILSNRISHYRGYMSASIRPQERKANDGIARAAERRRSIRNYASAAIPEAELRDLLRLAGRAPSAYNVQPWRFVVVQTPELKQKLSAAAYGQQQILRAPATIVMYSDMLNALQRSPESGQQHLDFHAGALGLRLVKKTINYDDPCTYHLYYGDTEGTPGSLLTFFPWPGARRGRAGVGQIAVTSLAIAPESIGYWLHRFVTNGVNHDALTRPFGNATIAFRDRDGLMLELVATEDATVRGAWADGPVPSEHAIHGVHAVTLWEESLERTEQALVEGLGFRRADSEDQTTRFSVGDGGSGAFVDVRVVGGFLSPLGGAGTIHHVAFRARDTAEQLQLREKVTSLGLHPTPVIDRTYFQSVYC